MIAQNSKVMANPLIDAIRQATEESSSGVEWLVIVHDDDRLIRSLASAMSEVSFCVIEVPQTEWSFQDSEMIEAIEWAIQHSSIKHLVLVGHSLAYANADQAASLDTQYPKDAGEVADRGYSRLRDGVTRTTAFTRKSKARFADQFERLSAIPLVREHILEDGLIVYGLFFMAESAAFLAYDVEQKDYVPLLL